jgi:hypothetical protein
MVGERRDDQFPAIAKLKLVIAKRLA